MIKISQGSRQSREADEMNEITPAQSTLHYFIQIKALLFPFYSKVIWTFLQFVEIRENESKMLFVLENIVFIVLITVCLIEYNFVLQPLLHTEKYDTDPAQKGQYNISIFFVLIRGMALNQVVYPSNINAMENDELKRISLISALNIVFGKDSIISSTIFMRFIEM